jgi:hypothetical protein
MHESGNDQTMTATETASDSRSREEREELRLLSAIASTADELLPLRRIVNHGQHQTLGAAGLLVPREVAEAYERLAFLATPLVALDIEKLINATGRVETSRAALTDAGRVRLSILEAKANRGAH